MNYKRIHRHYAYTLQGWLKDINGYRVVVNSTFNDMSIYIKDYPKITAKERPIYGSSRLGIMNKEVEFNLTGNFLSKSNSTIGIKEYELSDHLGNVSVVVLDRKECSISVIKPIVKTYTDYYPFGYPISSRTDNVDYRYGFNGQEGDGEIYGDRKSYTAEYWQYDSRLGRRWNVDPKLNISLSSYSCFSNNPLANCDLKGDTIINGLANILKKSSENLNQKQLIYNNLIKNHNGKLKKSDIRKYRRESGLRNAERSYNYWSSKKQTIDLMINTYSIVNPTEYNFLNNLPTNIVITSKNGVSEHGELNFMSTLIPAYPTKETQSSTNETTVYWDGNLKGDINIYIWDGAKFPYNTSYLANEFGDILYFYSNVIPNDPSSYEKWKTTGNSNYPGYWNDPSGAGQQSFKHQYEFIDKFNSIKHQYPERKVDTYNYIIKP